MSFIFDQKIETRESPHNGLLEVMLSRGRFRLDANNATYSFEDLYSNFSRSFVHLDIGATKLDSVLILGFGLGSIPLMLEDVFMQDARYTGVEIDPEIVQMVGNYLGETLLQKVQLVCQDAELFVQNDSGNYDIIAVDLFVNDKTPEKFKRASFLESLKQLLAPQGILMYNTLTDKEDQKLDSLDFFEQQFSVVFENAYGYDMGGNTMIIADFRTNN